MRAMVIDDEVAALELFRKMATGHAGIELLGAFSNPIEGLGQIDTLKPQVVFLDIQMPEFSGIYLAEQIVRLHPQVGIVFVTSHNEHALRAFELNALDYLLKPFTEARFNQCVNKLLRFGAGPLRQERAHNLSSQFRESAKRLFVNSEDETVLLRPEDIYYFEVRDKTVLLRCANNTYTSTDSLNYYEMKLQNSDFFRCHRSYLVNLSKVHRLINFTRRYGELGFADIKETVPVSKPNVPTLRKLLEF